MDRKLQSRAQRLVRCLRTRYADADCALTHSDALQLLVATVLSAQCTDERVNQVTPALFEQYRTASDYARADPKELESRIRPTGFFRNKSKSLIGLGQALVERHGGKVPDEMDALVELPGVGRKTANVLLGTWFDQPAIPVDTHVKRLANRLGLTQQSDPVKIERDLQQVFPRKDWTFSSHALILHGRQICNARRPECGHCDLRADCPFPDKR